MDMQTVQSQSPVANTSTVAGNAGNGASAPLIGEGGDSSFIQTLIQVIGDNESISNGDITTALSTASLPAALMMLIVPPQTAEELQIAAKSLLAWVHSLDQDSLQQLLEHPSLRQWVTNAGDLLQTGHSPAPIPELTGHVPEKQGQGLNAKIITADELQTVLKQFLRLAENNPSHPAVQQLGAELKDATSKLAQAFPALFPNTDAVEVPANGLMKTDKTSDTPLLINRQPSGSAMTNPSEHRTNNGNEQNGPKAQLTHQNDAVKIDKASGTPLVPNRQPSGSAVTLPTGDWTNNGNDQTGTRTQLLHRLSFLNHHVQLAVTEPPVGNMPVMSVTAAAPNALTDSAVQLSDNELVALANAADSQKSAPAVLEGNRTPLPSMQAQQFAQEMTRFLVKNMNISQLNGVSQARISLVPEHLGQLDVKITVHNGQITAHFMLESIHARDMLELQLPQLRTALQQQGFQVDKLEVSQNNHLGSSLLQDQKQQKSSQQFTYNGNKQPGDYDQSGTDFSFEIEQAVRINRLAYGNTFNATA